MTGNDSLVLFKHLQQCSSDQEICLMISRIQGPFALTYWSVILLALIFRRLPTKNYTSLGTLKVFVYLLRDYLGRRSLLWCREPETFILTSVFGVGSEHPGLWEEVSTNAIHCVSLNPLKDKELVFHSFDRPPLEDMDVSTLNHF